MSRPIKVPDALYVTLRKHAEAHGVSMQQALESHMRVLQERANQASADKDQLALELENREKALHVALQSATQNDQRVAALLVERDELMANIEAADWAHRDLGQELDALRSSVASASAELDHASAKNENLLRQRRALFSAVCVVGILVLAGLAVRKYMAAPKEEEPAVPETQSAVPSWY